MRVINYVGAELLNEGTNTDFNNLTILPQVKAAAHFDLSEYKVGPYVNFITGSNKNKNIDDTISTDVKNQYEVGVAVQRNFAEKLDLMGKIGYAGAKIVATDIDTHNVKTRGTAIGIGAIYDWQEKVKFITDYSYTKYKDVTIINQSIARKLRAHTSSVCLLNHRLL